MTDPPPPPSDRGRIRISREGGPAAEEKPGASDETLAGPGVARLPAETNAVAAGAATRSRPDPAGFSPSGSGADPSRLGRYVLVRQLGMGGMGVVWEAHDPELGRAVAIKLLSPASPGDGLDPLEIARFQREARLAARLRHPGIVSVYEHGIDGGRPYLAMECVRGSTFDEILESHRAQQSAPNASAPSRLREQVLLLAQVAAAVGFAHEQGVIHRDLKPANVILDPTGRPRVMDFGIAKDLGSGSGGAGSAASVKLTFTGFTLGTPAYMSPEQVVAAGDVGPWSDVWSLGVMLYEILVGRVPHDAEDTHELFVSICRMDPARPRQIDPSISEDLEAICLRALERDPRLRYRNAADLAADLQAWLDERPVRARRWTPFYRLRRSARRHRGALLATAALLCMLGAGLLAAGAARRSAAARQERTLAEIAAQVSSFEHAVRTREMTAEARLALAEQPLGLLARCLDDSPDSGVALAWRGRVRETLGDAARAQDDFDRACARSPASPLPWLLRGTHRLRRYRDSRGLPGMLHGPDGGVLAVRPESEDEREWRAQGLADLARIPTTDGEVAGIAPDEIRIARATAALHGDDPAGSALVLRLLEGVDGPAAMLIRGMARFYRRDFLEAQREFDAAALIWPFDASAATWRGNARLARAESLPPSEATLALADEARAAYEESLRLDASSAPALSGRAMALAACGDLEDALGRDGGDLLSRAVAAHDLAVARSPGDAIACYNRGNAHRRRGEIEEKHGRASRPHFELAVADQSTALQRAPGQPWAHLNRGNSLLLLWRAESRAGVASPATLDLALADFERAVELEPDEAGPRIMRATTHGKLALLDALREADPTPSLRRAEEDFAAALRLKPDDPEAHLNRANVYCELAEADALRGRDPRPYCAAALESLDARARALPDSTAHFGLRGTTLAVHGYYLSLIGEDSRAASEEAIALLDEAIRRAPEDGSARLGRGIAHSGLAFALLRTGRTPDRELALAESDFRAAAARRTPMAWALLGVLWSRFQRPDQAVTAFEQYALAAPAQAEWARARVAEIRNSPGVPDGDWKWLCAEAEKRLVAQDYPGAREQYRQALARFEREILEVDAGNRAARSSDPATRRQLVGAHYNLACILSVLSDGRTAPEAPSRPQPAGEQAALRDAALDHLAKAIDLGFRDAALLRDDTTLDPVRGDPRFAGLVERAR